MMDTTQLLLGIIGALLTGMWWSVRAYLTRMMAKIDAMEMRWQQLDKDCVKWVDLETVKLNVSGIDRRVTVLETTCKAEHGK